MNLPHPVHSEIEAHHPSSEGAVAGRPSVDGLGPQRSELGQSASSGLEGGALRAFVPGPGADGGGVHVDELLEGRGVGAGSHGPEDISEGRESFKAPLTRVLRVVVHTRPNSGYIYRLDLECGHRVSRLANASREPRPDLAPQDARCAPCAAILAAGRTPTQVGGELLEAR